MTKNRDSKSLYKKAERQKSEAGRWPFHRLPEFHRAINRIADWYRRSNKTQR